MTSGDFLVERLIAWGVKRVYGYSGDGINGIVGAMDRAKDRIEFVQVRHEEMAAFMACGHAKYTGEVGVCLATSGPGAIHLLNGLYDAQMDHVPVVAIVGQAATTALGGSYQQEVDLQTLFKDVAHEFVATIASPAAVRHVVDRAFRTAAAMRAVTAIIVPKDIAEEKAVPRPPHAHDTIHSGVGFSQPRVLPADADLRRAAEALNAGSKVAMLVGAGAKDAAGEVLAVADTLGAGIAKALLGKAVLPDDLPFVTGTIGLLGTGPSSQMMGECDTLLMVGSTFPYGEFLPKEGQARGVQIDIDGRNLGLRYPMEVNLIGDAAETLRALLPLLERKPERAWRDSIAAHKTRWIDVETTRAHQSADPVNPQRVFLELSQQLPERCVLSSDAGSNTNWTARYLQMRPGMKYALSGSLATMGPAVPYAIAAKFAYPDRVAIAITGDGAMQMNGNAELITIAKYWKRWADPRLVILVLNNRDLAQVTWEMRIESGDPKFEASQTLPDFPYASYAESIGLRGIRVDHPDQLADAWRRAFESDRPVLFEAVTDPNVATLPPHITLEQARAFATAFSKGDPEEVPAVLQSLKGLAANFLP
jgi:pyruvate dehydrogenase (quinone)